MFVLALLAMWLYDKGADMESYIVGLGALVLFVMFEVFVRSEKVVVDRKGVQHVVGFVSPRVLRIAYPSVARVRVDQSAAQKALRYGAIYVESPDGNVAVRGIAAPSRIKREIDRRLHALHAAHEHHNVGPHVGP